MMAVDGANSPVHQLSAQAQLADSDTISEVSRDTSSPNEVATPDDVSSPVLPIMKLLNDEKQASQNGKRSVVPSLPQSTNNNSYYFGESHVTRLESFVESMTGPCPSSQSSGYGQLWSTLQEWPNGVAASTAGNTPSRKVTPPSLPSKLGSNYNQPLDLSVKPRGGGGQAEHSRQKLNGSMSSSLPLKSSDSRFRTADCMTSSNAAGTGFSSAAGYPTLADMWIAHWLNMAASSLLTSLPVPLPGQHSHLPTPSSPLVSRLHDVSSSKNQNISPLLRMSMAAVSPNSSSSSSMSGSTPTKSTRLDKSAVCGLDSSAHASLTNGSGQRQCDGTSPHESSAFSMFQRHGLSHVDNRQSKQISNNSTSDVSGNKGSVMAALSAIESFVENSFSGGKNGKTPTVGRRQADVAALYRSSPTGYKRNRLVIDDHMTSSGDDDNGSCDGTERLSGSGLGAKRRRQHQQLLQPQHRQPTRRTAVREEHGDRQQVGDTALPSDSSTGPLEYLQCVEYDRPIDSEHPLESLEKLVHVQSTARRAGHGQRNGMTSSPVSPSTTSRYKRSDGGDANPPRPAVNVGDRSGADSQAICSSSADDVLEMASSGADDVSTVQQEHEQELTGSVCNSTAAAASLVCCNM